VFGEPGMEYHAEIAVKNRDIATAALEQLKSELGK